MTSLSLCRCGASVTDCQWTHHYATIFVLTISISAFIQGRSVEQCVLFVQHSSVPEKLVSSTYSSIFQQQFAYLITPVYVCQDESCSRGLNNHRD